MATFKKLPREQRWCMISNTVHRLFGLPSDKPTNQSGNPTVESIASSYTTELMTNEGNRVHSYETSPNQGGNTEDYNASRSDNNDTH